MPKLPIILCIMLVLCLWPVGARTYIVGNDGLATHKSIGEAISAASTGDTVYMKSGVYNEDVKIDKRIAIKPLTGEKGTILLDGSNKETGITIVASGCSIEGLTFKNFSKAGIVIQSNDNTIKNNQFISDKPGVMIQGSSNNMIEGNSMKDCVTGVVLWRGASRNKISNNNIEGGIASVTLKGAGGNFVTGNTLSNGGAGVALENSSAVTVSRNIVKGGTNGIIIYNSSDCNLSDNTERGNKRAVYILNTTRTELYNESIIDGILGIMMENSNYNVIRGCTVNNTTEALSLGASPKNTVISNSILNTKDLAIEIVYSNGNALTGNRISHADTGVNITESSGNRLEDNKLKDVKLGMIVLGGDRQSFDNAIDESNTEDSKPIAYFFGQSNKVVQDRALSHLTLAYCNNFTVENNTISNDALLLFSSRSSKILENNVSKCHGMVLQDSISNEIFKNIVIGNSFSGIFLFDSGSNTIR
ncbi:Right handed beta helix region [uncultured archaeon]|nr:Right handed beta helix region [uncultured archaeon]